MNKKRWIALGAAAILLVFSLGLNTVMALFKSDFFSDIDSFMTDEYEAYEYVLEDGDTNNRIAYLQVDGTIQDVGSGSLWETESYDHQAFLYQLESILNDDTVAGIVLMVNSPGGGVIESAQIYDKLVEIKELRRGESI